MKNILTLFISLFTTTLSAQWTTDPFINTTVRDSVGFEESVPLTATTPDGKTWVSYFALYSGSYQMHIQLFDSAGNKLFGDAGLVVSSYPQSTAVYRYDLKSDGSGNAILAFQDTRAGDLHVVVYKIDQQGNQLWGNSGLQLIDPQSTQGLAPTIGFTNAGNIIISWNASSASGQWVAFRKLDSFGSYWWPTVQTIKDPTGTKRYGRPSTVPVGNDGFSMLYVETTGFGLGVSNMYAIRYDNMGVPVWAQPVHISTYTISFFFMVEAVSDGFGGFYTGFTTSNVSNPAFSDVYVQHTDSSGNLWNATGNVAATTANSQRFFASGKVDSFNGDFWVIIKATDPNQNQSGAIVQKFTIGGATPIGPNGAVLAITSAAYNDPWDLTITTDGVIGCFITGNGALQTLNAAKCDLSGAPLWNGGIIQVCTKSSSKDDVSAGLFLNDQAVVVWMDQRNDMGVYIQNITNDGLLGNPTGTSESAVWPETLAAYPNPFQEQFTVETPFNSDNAAFILRDVTGRMVREFRVVSKEEAQITFSAPGLSSGLYFLEVTTPHASGVVRLMKK